jgi:hypothetical protein
VLERPGVAGGDPRAQAAVLAEREHLGAVLARDRGRVVGRAVVDHEHVGARNLAAELVEHGREVLLLVPGGDEDERVVAHCARVTPRERESGWAAIAISCSNPTPRRRQ